MEQVKLLGATAVLTLLVWTAADSLVNQTITISASLEPIPAASNSDMLVRLDPPNKQCTIQLAGPRRAIETVQSATTPRLRLLVPEKPTGAASLSLENDLVKRQLSDLSRDFARLSVVSIQPSEVQVQVDRMVAKDLELTLIHQTLNYEDKPRINPPTVSVRIRESRAAELAKAGPWQVIDLSAEVERTLHDLPAGEPVTVSIPLDAKAFGADAVITPKLVEVTATLKSAVTTAEIPAVPIRLAMSFANLQRPLRVVSGDGTSLTLVTQTISVSGPIDEVGKLQRGETRAYGIVQLKDADFEQIGVVRAFIPEFQLPKGLELSGNVEPVEFKLIDAATEPRPAGG